jgi:hypothetical protein
MNSTTRQPKTYILQKDLPNVNAGAVLKLSKRDTCYQCPDKFGDNATFSRKLIENNPEWFKKEEPKEWEVVSFRGTKPSNNGLFTLREDGLYYYEWWQGLVAGMAPESLMPNTTVNNCTEIHSVKRLSDGKVFTIGGDTNFGEIAGFKIHNNELWATIKGKESPAFFNDLHHKQPQQKPIEVEIKDAYVGGTYRHTNDKGHFYPYYIEIYANDKIPTEKYEPIKKAIEGVLNGVEQEALMGEYGGGRVDIYGRQIFEQDKITINSKKYYSSDQLLEAEKKAFEAAREIMSDSSRVQFIPYATGNKYKTFSDYKSLNK